MDGLPATNVRIARRKLREVLIQHASSNCEIRWGEGCIDAERLDNGRIKVQLSSGETDECDLVVVADGANSKIRQSLRPDGKPRFTGTVSITGIATFVDDVPPPVDKDWGVLTGGEGHSLFVSPIDEHRALWSINYKNDELRNLPQPEDNPRRSFETRLCLWGEIQDPR